MLCNQLPVCDKFKFYFLALSGIKKKYIFDPQLVESTDAETWIQKVDCNVLFMFLDCCLPSQWSSKAFFPLCIL